LNEPECDYLDVSGMPAPEPLHQALIAVERLSPGRFIHFHHRQYPRLLFEQLERRGFDSATRHGPDGSCEVFIWAIDDPVARQKALTRAASYPPWKTGER
jgi:hypothetical protein|tara:strand:- start:149 stop:448 length:300 start_codon:yes stop_codon:yes gene_type:complete